MEPENEALEEEISIKKPSFSGSILVFGGVKVATNCRKILHPPSIHHPPGLAKRPIFQTVDEDIQWRRFCEIQGSRLLTKAENVEKTT